MKFFVRDDLREQVEQHFMLRENKNRYEYDGEIKAVSGTFVIEKFVISKRRGRFELEVRFKVCHAYIDAFYYHEEKDLSNISDCIDKLMEILWDYRPCRECLMELTNDKFCERCSVYNMVNEYGIEKKKITELPSCSICMEDVLHSKLHCGHYFHAGCLVQMNHKPYLQYYDDTDLFKCPNCREKMNLTDYKNVFLYDEMDEVFGSDSDDDSDEDTVTESESDGDESVEENQSASL
jgi:hypothetical protein